MKIKVRIAEEKDVERVAALYEKLHDYLETHIKTHCSYSIFSSHIARILKKRRSYSHSEKIRMDCQYMNHIYIVTDNNSVPKSSGRNNC